MEMTYMEMLSVLERDKDIDIEKFDYISPKTLAQLFEEIQSKEVNLFFDETTKRVVRAALGVTVLIVAPDYGVTFLETKREFLRTHTVIHRIREYTLSETRKLGETIEDAAIRGLLEETKLVIPQGRLVNFTAQPQPILEYHSSAYRGIWSRTAMFDFLLKLPYMPWTEEIREFNDNGTRLTIEQFPH